MNVMSDVIIEKKNEVFVKLHCEPHILYELQPYFTFEVESAKFMSQYRSRHWDDVDQLNYVKQQFVKFYNDENSIPA